MKIWVDDLRDAPEDWLWLKNSDTTIRALNILRLVGSNIEVMSLDHDLGGDDTTRPVVIWMIENEFWPDQIFVHSMNSVGRQWIQEMIVRYRPEAVGWSGRYK